MTEEFENEIENDETPEETSTNAEAAGIVNAIRGEEYDDDDFFAEDEAAEIPQVDPATVITIRTSQGSDVYIEAHEPMALVDAIARCGVRFNGDYTCWLNGQEVGLGTVVSGGQTVTVVGAVKGGER